MEQLAHPLAPEIQAVRELILDADARIRESIKWNAPSFSITEHFATFNLRQKDVVQVVLHTGAKVKSNVRHIEIRDPSGLLKWAAKDRCIAEFTDRKDIKSRGAAFQSILEQWIKQAL
jgi:hypothetical protein